MRTNKEKPIKTPSKNLEERFKKLKEVIRLSSITNSISEEALSSLINEFNTLSNKLKKHQFISTIEDFEFEDPFVTVTPIKIGKRIIKKVSISTDLPLSIGDKVLIQTEDDQATIIDVFISSEEREKRSEKKGEMEKESEDYYSLEDESRENNIKNENELLPDGDFQMAKPERRSFFKKTFKRIGIGGLVLSGGALSILFNILQFVFVAFVGLSTIGWAISLFSKGSIILGLLVLLILTPISIGLASYFFIFFFVLTIIALIGWGISHLFGFDISFGNVWGSIWLIIKVIILGSMAYVGIIGFLEAVKEKRVSEFLKEHWWGILLFSFLFWLFFL